MVYNGIYKVIVFKCPIHQVAATVSYIDKYILHSFLMCSKSIMVITPLSSLHYYVPVCDTVMRLMLIVSNINTSISVSFLNRCCHWYRSTIRAVRKQLACVRIGITEATTKTTQDQKGTFDWLFYFLHIFFNILPRIHVTFLYVYICI